MNKKNSKDLYTDNLELKDIILEIANDLLSPIPLSEYSSNSDEYWMSKYVHCHRDITKKI